MGSPAVPDLAEERIHNLGLVESQGLHHPAVRPGIRSRNGRQGDSLGIQPFLFHQAPDGLFGQGGIALSQDPTVFPGANKDVVLIPPHIHHFVGNRVTPLEIGNDIFFGHHQSCSGIAECLFLVRPGIAVAAVGGRDQYIVHGPGPDRIKGGFEGRQVDVTQLDFRNVRGVIVATAFTGAITCKVLCAGCNRRLDQAARKG